MGKAKQRRTLRFDPLAWGILFFTIWITTITVGELDTFRGIVSWALIAVSVILFLSIFIPPLALVMSTETAEQIFLPTMFIFIIFSFTIGWIGSLKDISGWEQTIVVIFGFLWLIAYLVVLVRTASRNLGIAFATVFFILGIYILVTDPNKWGGAILLGIGVILCLVATRIIPVCRIPIFGGKED